MNPVPQFVGPPGGSLGPSASTTKPGRSSDSLPSPYTVQAPSEGWPSKIEPVFACMQPATCVKPSAVQLLTMQRSSATVAISGYQSLTHGPDWPCWTNLHGEAISGVPLVTP